MPPADVSAIVLCGGQSRRFGSDKTQAPYADSTVLDTLLDSLPQDWLVVCVGPSRPTTRPVAWTLEDPAGGGPLAGIAAAAVLVASASVVVLAGDQPAAGPAAIRLAHALASSPVAAVVAVDEGGRPNPLLAAYRTIDLRAALPAECAGRPARTLLDLPHDTLGVAAPESADIDTPDDLDRLRRLP